jgi:hypothetical protein
MSTWYTILTYSGAYNPTPARGPHPSLEDANEAVEAFKLEHGSMANHYLRATAARIAGPFATEEEAEAADISMDVPIVRILA